MSLLKTTKFINFHNKTSISVMIETWVDYSSQLQISLVNPGEKLHLYSSVGEWHLSKNNYDTIGKFRSNPCASGNYYWIEDDLFNCVYSENAENDIIGLMTFYEK